LIYLDTSALVKLVVSEPETDALQRFIVSLAQEILVTSALTRAELLRAAHRRDLQAVGKAREVLASVGAITITESLLEHAGSMAPSTLRTLDAIHLATAAELGPELRGFVAYDARLLQAASRAGISTLTPR
jgi:predicted nucleic acid-binding protein